MTHEQRKRLDAAAAEIKKLSEELSEELKSLDGYKLMLCSIQVGALTAASRALEAV